MCFSLHLTQHLLLHYLRKADHKEHKELTYKFNRLLACVRVVGQHFKQFYYRQLKNGQLDEMSVKVAKM